MSAPLTVPAVLPERPPHVDVRDQTARVVELRQALEMQGVDLDANEWLDAIEGETDFQEAIAEAARAVLELECQIAGIKAMEERLGKRRGRIESSVETLRGVILGAMDKAGVPSVRCPFATITTKPKPRELGEIEESKIPSDYFTPQPPKLDRLALRAALRKGGAVPGANLDNGGITLSLRFL
jgi:hypothetical protein